MHKMADGDGLLFKVATINDYKSSYRIMFIKRLDNSLRLQLLRQKSKISPVFTEAFTLELVCKNLH